MLGEKRELLPLPAIVLYYDDKLRNADTYSDIGQTTFDVASLLIPGGALTQMSKFGRIAHISDKVSSIASIMANAAENQDPEFSNLMSKISLVAGIADFSYQGVKGLKKIRAKYLNQKPQKAKENLEGLVNFINETDQSTIIALNQKQKLELNTLISLEINALNVEKLTIDAGATSRALNKLNGVSNPLEVRKATILAKLKKQVGRDITYTKFIETIYEANKVSESNLVEAYELWADKKWIELYELFNPSSANKINGGWPPFNGFIGKPEIIAGEKIKDKFSNLVFDRFQTVGKDRKGNPLEFQKLGGGFASPVEVNKYGAQYPFTYKSRALMDELQEGTYYIKFKMLSTKNIEFRVGEAMPWKTKRGVPVEGMANQVLTNIKFHNMQNNVDYKILQRSVKRGTKWTHEIDDFSKQLDIFKFCN